VKQTRETPPEVQQVEGLKSPARETSPPAKRHDSDYGRVVPNDEGIPLGAYQPINQRINGVPVRIYSVAKTVADCLKYRAKINVNLLLPAVQEGLQPSLRRARQEGLTVEGNNSWVEAMAITFLF